MIVIAGALPARARLPSTRRARTVFSRRATAASKRSHMDGDDPARRRSRPAAHRAPDVRPVGYTGVTAGAAGGQYGNCSFVRVSVDPKTKGDNPDVVTNKLAPGCQARCLVRLCGSLCWASITTGECRHYEDSIAKSLFNRARLAGTTKWTSQLEATRPTSRLRRSRQSLPRHPTRNHRCFRKA